MELGSLLSSVEAAPLQAPEFFRGLSAVLQHVFAVCSSSVALSGSQGSLTYAELDARSAGVAARLRAAGVAPGDVVPLVLPRSLDMIVAMVAVVRTGAIYAPVDPAAPPLRSTRILQALHARVGLAPVTGPAWLQADGGPQLQPTMWLSLDDAAPVVHGDAQWHPGSWNDTLYIMFTSGSTGVPKGVVVPASGIPPLVRGVMGKPPLPCPRWSQASSPAFDISNLEIWGALLKGGCCAVLDEQQPSLDDLARFFRERGITHGQLTAGLFNAMVEDYLPCFSGLRQMIIGGDRASPDHVRAFMLAHPHVRFVNGYGPTETTIYSTLHEVTLDDTLDPAGIPIGRPVDGTVCRVVPHGEDERLGELWHAGTSLALGYFERPDLTAERFIQEGDIRWYRTGDLVRRREDGILESHGRLDRQVKVQGVRIELDEVELAIVAYPGIDQAVAFARGESAESTRLVAWYSAKEGAAAELSLRAFLSQRLPPAAIPCHLLWRAAMPININGKIDRGALQHGYDMLTLGKEANPKVPPAGFLTALKRALEMAPSRVALESGRDAFTYAELDQQSAHVAVTLRRLGVKQGDIVALVMPRSAALVVAMVGVLRCGAVYAPLSAAGSAAPLATTLEVLSPALCVVSDAFAILPSQAPADCKLIGASALWAPGMVSSPAVEWAEVDPSATACVMFTSGSTGVPKGVCVPHAGLLRLVHGASYATFVSGQRWAFWSPPAFDATHLEIWAPLLNGGTCVVMEEDEPSLDDRAVFLQQRRISDAWLTSSLFNAIVDTQPSALGGLSQLLIGGERLSRLHVATFLEQVPAVTLINGYGPTENTTFTTCHRITTRDLEEPLGLPIGQAVQGTVLRIEPAAGDPDEGELWAGGCGVANGYLGNPAATAERFVMHDGQRWYRTGDLVRRRADGALLYLGRTDRQIKLQGHRIELDAIERILTTHAAVREAIVVVVGDEAHDRYLAAAYTYDPATAVTPEVLAAWLHQQLPAHAVPHVLKPLVAVPRTINGKVDREAALGLLRLPSEQPSSTAATPPVLAFDPDLQNMAALWRRFLPAAPVDPRASFTQLGGTSVLALLLATTIRRELNRRVSAVELLRRPLLQEHADLVAHAASESPESAPLPPAAQANDGWLTELQSSLLSAEQLDDGTGSMLLHISLCLPPALAPGRIKEAFSTIVQRHPMLRLCARHLGDRVHTRLLDTLPHGWWTEHDTALVAFPGDLAWPPSLLALIRRPLNVAEQGPMRVDLWPVRAAAHAPGHLLVWTVHHFATDEIGIDNVLSELDALLKGQSLAPVYGTPFVFSAVERSAIDHDGIRLRAEALVRDLHGVQLPFEHRGQPANEQHHRLSPALAQALHHATARWQTTPFAPVLAAYGLALQEVFGAAARHVLTPFSRRSEPQLLEPVTFFLDLRFIEAGARAGEGAAAHLQRVQRDTLLAQQPTFQPLLRVARMLATLSAEATRYLTAFAFTWREAPVRAVSLGEATAQLIRAPQEGARFGLALHAAMLHGEYSFVLEAAAPVHAGGWDTRVWKAFCGHLARVCAVERLVEEGTLGGFTGAHPGCALRDPSLERPAADDNAAVADRGLRTVLAAAWRRWAPLAHDVPLDDGNFMAQGGTSLGAMRLAAQIKREVGITLDLAVFLRSPTFARLCALCAEALANEAGPCTEVAVPRPAPLSIEDLVWVGDAQAQKVVFVIPGDGGHAVGLFQVATELRRALGPEVAIALLELADVVERSPEASVARAVCQRVIEIVHAIGVQRVAAMVGYSLGGLLALQVAQTLQLPREVAVCLLDTYAPLPHRHTPLRYLEGKIARLAMFLRGWRPESFLPLTAQDEAVSLHDSRGNGSWHALLQQLHGQSGFMLPSTSVLLIQAERSQFSTGLLWRRATNGFNPRAFRRLAVYRVPIGHLDLPKQSASAVAHLITAQMALLKS